MSSKKGRNKDRALVSQQFLLHLFYIHFTAHHFAASLDQAGIESEDISNSIPFPLAAAALIFHPMHADDTSHVTRLFPLLLE